MATMILLISVLFLTMNSLCAFGQSTSKPPGVSQRNISVAINHSSSSTTSTASSTTRTQTSTPSTSTRSKTTTMTSTSIRPSSTRTKSTIPSQLFKTGICPVSTSIFGDCTVSCVSDASCEGTRKCCLINGCGLKCLKPVNQTSTNNPEIQILGQDLLNPRKVFPPADSTLVAIHKNGQCPKAAPNPSAGRCVHDECSPTKGDAECSGSRKCCQSQDGTSCMICTDVRVFVEAISPVPENIPNKTDSREVKP